jgi:hypothetical protein
MQCYATSSTTLPPFPNPPPTSDVALGAWTAPPWTTAVHPRYFLPQGSEVNWTFDAPSGQCISEPQSWTDWVWSDQPGAYASAHGLMTVPAGSGCNLGQGTWKVTVHRPDGSTRYSWITFTTAEIYDVHTFSGNCQSGDQQCYAPPAYQAASLPDPLQTDVAIGAW